MENILVPTDFSKNCEKAADLGIKMAKLYDSEIHFYHLMQTPVDWVQLDKLKEKRYPDTLKKIGIAKAKLRELERKAEKEGLECRTFLEYDAGQVNILRGVVREIIGSNVEQIVRKAKVPVIVIKEDAVTFPFKNIVFVSDFQEDVKSAFKEVISIASKCNAHIHLLQINTETDYNSIKSGKNWMSLLLKDFPELQDYSEHIYNEHTVEIGINQFIEQNEADLIAMCTHGRTGFLRLFSNSIAEGITNHSTLPVMTIHI